MNRHVWDALVIRKMNDLRQMANGELAARPSGFSTVVTVCGFPEGFAHVQLMKVDDGVNYRPYAPNYYGRKGYDYPAWRKLSA